MVENRNRMPISSGKLMLFSKKTGLMIDAFSIPNGVMISADKDLRINPFESYDVDEGKHLVLPKGDTFGWIERKFWLTPSGKSSSKMIGKGEKFFWAQKTMASTTDLCSLHGALAVLYLVVCRKLWWQTQVVTTYHLSLLAVVWYFVHCLQFCSKKLKQSISDKTWFKYCLKISPTYPPPSYVMFSS